jgi:hypothetical protein
MAMHDEPMGRRPPPDAGTRALARGLGWFSLALGVAEVTAPRRLARALGMDGYDRLVLAYGVREIVTGIGILAARDPTPWIWGRVAGDTLDLATASAGLADDNPRRDKVGLAMVALLGVTALDLYCAGRLTEERDRPRAPLRDHRDRSGWPRPAKAMLGAARANGFETPADMRGPEALRPYRDGSDPLSTATPPT